MSIFRKIWTLLSLEVESMMITVRFIREMFKNNNISIKEKLRWIRTAQKSKTYIRNVTKQAKRFQITVASGNNLDKLNKIRGLYRKDGESDAEYRERIIIGILNGDI